MPAAKRLTPQQQRERKAKLALIPLSVVLLLVMALELPKLMGGGKKTPSATPAVAGATTTTAAPTPAQAAVGLASLVVAATSQAGQLNSFSRFKSKDPFKALVSASAGAAGGSAPAAKPGGGVPTKPAAVTLPKPQSVPFSVPKTPTAAAKPEGPMVLAAVLKVNGQKKVIPVNTAFPEQNPIFKLVAVGKNAVWVSLVGGSFGNGDQSLKIEKGQPVKLVNETANLNYLIELVKMKLVPKPAPVAAPPVSTGLSTTSTSSTSTTSTTATIGG